MSEDGISIPADMDLNDLKAGIYKCEAYENWNSEHLQQPISYLTEENLDWLEQHCEKTIEHATRNTFKEHLMVLELIKEHKNYLSLREDYLRRMKASNEVLRKQGYISKDKIKERLEQTKKVYDEEMKPYMIEVGNGEKVLNVTYLSKKEKEELINKRNCLLVQIKTYELLLEEK